MGTGRPSSAQPSSGEREAASSVRKERHTGLSGPTDHGSKHHSTKMLRAEEITVPARFLTTVAHFIATLTIVYDVVRSQAWLLVM